MNRFNVSRKRGLTVLELTIASLFTVLAMGGVVGALFMSSSNWLRGSARSQAEVEAQRGVRIISDELRQAMLVGVDADGMGVTYRVPTKDASGAFTVPPVWDNVTRRIEVNGSSIRIVTGGQSRTIVRNVRPTDPSTNATYRLFTPGVGSVTRSVTILIATNRFGDRNRTYSGRYRETIFLRNIPELIR